MLAVHTTPTYKYNETIDNSLQMAKSFVQPNKHTINKWFSGIQTFFSLSLSLDLASHCILNGSVGGGKWKGKKSPTKKEDLAGNEEWISGGRMLKGTTTETNKADW